MRQTWIAALFLILSPTAGNAAAVPDASAPFPTDHQRAQQFAGNNDASPYAMNYTDEAARVLGVRDGRWEAFDIGSSDPLVPSLKAGVDSGGAMLRLQWRSGQ